MSDLIDRQAAIDALGGNEPVGDPSKMDDDDVVKMWERIRIINIIYKLPSAQPETHEERTETHACDLISRQAAIRWVKTECNPYGKPTLDFESGKKVIEHLKQMPSAQSERQKGEWIDYTEDGYVECPFCHSATNCDGNKDELHFCFSCGADMREPEDIPMEYFESGGR